MHLLYLLLNLHFATSFYAEAKESGGHNFVFSPLSLQKGLVAAAEIADEATKKDILTPLCLEDGEALPSFEENAFLTLADNSWSDFAFPEVTRRNINAWVEEKTAHRISELIPAGSVNAETKLVLVNTLYFRSPWKNPFDENNSFLAPFYGLEKSLRPIPYMRKSALFGYLKEADHSVIELPFQENFSLFVVLPDLGTSLQAIENHLSTRLLQHWIEDSELRHLDLSLPKFKVAASLPAKVIFQKMGMSRAFDPTQGDFGLGEGVVITDILHQAVFEIDEEGGTGAAATGVVIGVTCMPYYQPVVVNRPFLIFVVDKTTHTILFAGRIQQPRN